MQDIQLLPIILIWSLFVIAAIVVGIKHFIVLTGISDLISYDTEDDERWTDEDWDDEGWDDDFILENYDNLEVEPYIMEKSSKEVKILEAPF
ncbi:MAG: hypothetical protein HeimC2_20050 [Candidatus Heimdallarchaeota archaeon LC_2]|nr:MAG: hypothetical protein HeimC2_20050 [Candidatus Heimdallarchaeota archaeon LC_2]